MNAKRRDFWNVLAGAAVLACSTVAALVAVDVQAQTAQNAAAKNKLVIQVSDADPKKWGLALNNARNVQQDLGRDLVEIEIVAYGPGIGMLKIDSEVGTRVSEAIGDGVKLVACENTMANQKLTRDDLLPRIGYAKSGVVEIIQKQQQGYAYIRP